MMDPTQTKALLDRARAIPITKTLGFEIDDLGDGTCRARMPRRKEFDGVFESLHGGILMTFADSIACFALMTRIGTEEAVATTDMNIRFLAPCLTDVRGQAKVIKCGRTLAPIRVELFDDEDRLVALADVNYIRLGPR